MESQVPALIEVLRQVPDPRQRRGIRHPLAALLALACAAMLGGARSYAAIVEWGRNCDPAFLQALGFTRQTAPCGATYFQVFRKLARTALEQVLGAWAEAVLAATAPADGRQEALALDGKTLRGSRKQGALVVHLLSVAQAGVDHKTNEVPVAGVALAGLMLHGRVFTMDARLTQRSRAAQIVAGGGDYLMVAKGIQPTLERDIATVFCSPPPRASGGSGRSRGTRPTDGSRGAS